MVGLRLTTAQTGACGHYRGGVRRRAADDTRKYVRKANCPTPTAIIYDGNLTVTDANRLQTLQNRCARLVTGALFRSPTITLLNDLGWERLETRRLIHKLLFYHRLYYNNPVLPSYVTDLSTGTRHDDTGLRLRNESHVSVPPTRLQSFHRSYIPSTTRQWNLLPSSLHMTTFRKDFARQVWQRFGAPDPPLFHSHGSKTGNKLHTRLRLKLSNTKCTPFPNLPQQHTKPIMHLWIPQRKH